MTQFVFYIPFFVVHIVLSIVSNLKFMKALKFLQN